MLGVSRRTSPRSRASVPLTTAFGLFTLRVQAPSTRDRPTPAVPMRALMSQVVGKPVRVQSMRWDENGYSPFAQSNVADVQIGLDANDKVIAYDYKSFMMPFSNNPMPATTQIGTPVPADSTSFTSVRGAMDASGVNTQNAPAPGARIETFASGDQYTTNIPNRRVTGKVPPSMFAVTPLRAPCCIQPGFVSESFIDEVAHAAGRIHIYIAAA